MIQAEQSLKVSKQITAWTWPRIYPRPSLQALRNKAGMWVWHTSKSLQNKVSLSKKLPWGILLHMEWGKGTYKKLCSASDVSSLIPLLMSVCLSVFLWFLSHLTVHVIYSGSLEGISPYLPTCPLQKEFRMSLPEDVLIRRTGWPFRFQVIHSLSDIKPNLISKIVQFAVKSARRCSQSCKLGLLKLPAWW